MDIYANAKCHLGEMIRINFALWCSKAMHFYVTESGLIATDLTAVVKQWQCFFLLH